MDTGGYSVLIIQVRADVGLGSVVAPTKEEKEECELPQIGPRGEYLAGIQ